jgi:hypothetical protein
MTLYEVGFEYFAGVTMKFIFRDGVLCSLVEVWQHFRGSCCILAHFTKTAQPHIPEDAGFIIYLKVNKNYVIH